MAMLQVYQFEEILDDISTVSSWNNSIILYSIKCKNKIPTTFENKTDIWKPNISNRANITFLFLCGEYIFFMLQNSPITFALIIFYFLIGLLFGATCCLHGSSLPSHLHKGEKKENWEH